MTAPSGLLCSCRWPEVAVAASHVLSLVSVDGAWLWAAAAVFACEPKSCPRQLVCPQSCEPQSFDQLVQIAGQAARRMAGSTRGDRGFRMRGQNFTAPRAGARCNVSNFLLAGE